MDRLWILVIGMAVVTYLPRMIPMVILQEIKLHPYLKRFLEFIPFAVLGALIFPGIIYSTSNKESAIFGTVIAVIIALFNVNLVFVVFGAILGVYLWNLFL